MNFFLWKNFKKIFLSIVCFRNAFWINYFYSLFDFILNTELLFTSFNHFRRSENFRLNSIQYLSHDFKVRSEWTEKYIQFYYWISKKFAKNLTIESNSFIMWYQSRNEIQKRYDCLLLCCVDRSLRHVFSYFLCESNTTNDFICDKKLVLTFLQIQFRRFSQIHDWFTTSVSHLKAPVIIIQSFFAIGGRGG